MLCPKCDTQNRDNAKFCKVCGYSFTAEDVAASKAATTIAGNTQSATTSQGTAHASASSINEVAPSSPGDVNEVAPQQAQAVEVVVQPEPVASAQTTQSAQSAQNTTLPEDDISLAPTQILTPQEMVAFQARRWQQESGHTSGENHDTNVSRPSAESDIPHPNPNEQPVPTAIVQQQPEAQIASPNSIGVATTPTVTMSQSGDVVEGEPTQIPPPPPSESQLAATGSDPSVSHYAEQAAAPPASVTPPAQDTTVSQEATPVGTDLSSPSSVTPPAQDASTPPIQDASSVETDSSRPLAPSTDVAIGTQGRDESVPTDDASSSGTEGRDESVPTDDASSGLAAGTLVAGRYEVMQPMHADEQEHVYSVIDRQGYKQCWNCGSKENAEGDEFCIDCGAELLNANYLMHEYAASAGGNNDNNDAHVLQGTMVNTFVDGGKTYVIEQQHTAQLAFPNGIHIVAAGDSDAGNVRRSEPNEDSTLVLQFQRVHESHASPVGVFVVADGMGGHDNGQGASRMAINIIADKVVRELLLPPLETEKNGGLTASVTPMEEDALVGVFKGAVEEANNVLVQTNQHDKTDMGSTLTGFMIVGDAAFIINVGDSRTYMLREGTLYQLTSDHSLVAQLLAGGLIEPDDVYTHPQRSQIFRSLGDKTNVQIDDFKQQLLPGDILLSCSDGLWEMVRNPQITDILKNAHDPQTACTQLIEAANANGGEDNVSVIIVFVR